MIHIELNRVKGDFGFEAKDAKGHIVKTDNSPEDGGANFGVRPMQMVLMSLGACSGIDVVSILKKQKQEIKDFRIELNGEREPGKVPSLWIQVKVIFELSGNIELSKAQRACHLSIEKYCSVAETLRRAGCNITWDVKVNNQ